MRTYLLFPLMLLLFVGAFQELRATHHMGRSMSYECIGVDTLKLTVTEYEDCMGARSGGPFTPWPPPPAFLTFSPTTASNCLDPAQIQGWTNLSVVEVTPICAGSVSGCGPPFRPTTAPGGINGALEHTWESVFDFSVTTCRQFLVEWSSCCRSSAITSGANDDALYQSMNIDLSILPCNSSPQFLHKFDTYLCSNRASTISYQAYDPDGDSLVYRLAPCYQGANNPVGYDPGFSPQNPLGPSWNVSIDSRMGDLTILPNPGAPVIAVVCVEVEEYRNGVSLGKIWGDIQIFVIQCQGNSSPILDNFTPISGAFPRSDFTLDACVGVPLTFGLRSRDPDLGDTLTTTIDTSWASGSIYTISGTNPQMLTVSWIPTAPGRYFFPVIATDQWCPLPGRARRTIVVEVSRFCVDANITYTACDSSNGAIDLTVLGGQPPYRYRWNTGDTTQDLTGLTPGFYDVTVVDQAGDSTSRKFTLHGPDLLLNPNILYPTCNDSSGAINLNVTGGSAPYSYQWNTGDTTSYLLNTKAKTGYSVSVLDASGCPRNGAWRIPAPDSCFNVIEGLAYFDSNHNCQYDLGEYLLPNVQIQLQNMGIATLIDSSGRYSVTTFQRGDAIMEATVPAYMSPQCFPNGIDTVELDSLGMIVNWDVGFWADSVYDLVAGRLAATFRPGFHTAVPVVVSNAGVQIQNGTLSWKYDSLYHYIQSNPPETRHDSANRLVEWDFNQLGPGGILVFRAVVRIDSFVPIGTRLYDTVRVDPVVGDTTPINNIFYSRDIVQGSFDPNDKQATPAQRQAEGWLLSQEEILNYTIRFQNTGNDTAFFVVIRDTLDVSVLDIQSLKMLEASHSYTVRVLDERYLEVRFDNILLPDSTTNLKGSQGYVSFSINRFSNLSPGTTIENNAAIFFDFNKPVITNTVLRTIYKGMVGATSPVIDLCYTDPVPVSIDSGISPYTFYWPDGYVEQGNSSGSSSHMLDSSGYYQVRVVDDAEQEIQLAFDLSVDTMPDARFTMTFPQSHWVDAEGLDGNDHWEWDFGDGTTGEGKIVYHYYLHPGQYTIRLITENNCGRDTSYQQVDVAVGIEKVLFAKSVKVAPNPMSSTATISFDNPQQQGFNLGLYDLQGHEVRSYSVTNGERFTVDKGDLQAGVYIFKLSGPTSYYGRLVIQ